VRRVCQRSKGVDGRACQTKALRLAVMGPITVPNSTMTTDPVGCKMGVLLLAVYTTRVGFRQARTLSAATRWVNDDDDEDEVVHEEERRRDHWIP
jgi:hypothetical protein